MDNNKETNDLVEKIQSLSLKQLQTFALLLNEAFVKNVHLKGFKSIKDLEVRLNNGLNIIIGPNGSGKTTFLETLSYALDDGFSKDFIKQPYSFHIEFDIVSEKLVVEETSHGDFRTVTKHNRFSTSLVKSKIILNDKTYEYDGTNMFALSLDEIKDKMLLIYNKLYAPTVIPFNISDHFAKSMLTELGNISINLDLTQDSTFNVLANIFEKDILDEFFSIEIVGDLSLFKKNINKYLELNNSLIENLKKYSPINDLRLSPSLSTNISDVDINSHSSGININYLMLEFYVNNTWLTWKQLSDGTKRLFYIILNTICGDRGLILIEEPENGVHPDQLFLLLDFFKEQSKFKQIIITTHSPEVLNILGKDELDRIIVTRYEEGRGTQMHHLSEKKIKKAKAYMSAEGLALKDFWVHSNLEEFDEEEKD